MSQSPGDAFVDSWKPQVFREEFAGERTVSARRLSFPPPA
jgi:hypothetical protein